MIIACANLMATRLSRRLYLCSAVQPLLSARSSSHLASLVTKIPSRGDLESLMPYLSIQVSNGIYPSTIMMQRSARATMARGRTTLRPESTTPRLPSESRARAYRVQKRSDQGKRNSRNTKRRRVTFIRDDARDDGLQASSPGLGPLNDLRQQDSIHACSEASLEFVGLSNLETDDDTNIIALNLMDFHLSARRIGCRSYHTANYTPPASSLRVG